VFVSSFCTLCSNRINILPYVASTLLELLLLIPEYLAVYCKAGVVPIMGSYLSQAHSILVDGTGDRQNLFYIESWKSYARDTIAIIHCMCARDYREWLQNVEEASSCFFSLCDSFTDVRVCVCVCVCVCV
jgi:hypothetical protein